MELQDLAREYQNRTDDELLRLAFEPADLTPEANTALNIELSKRRLNQLERLEAFRHDELQCKEEPAKDPGKLGVIHGIGRKRFGKANYNYNSETGFEQFRTTIFIVLFWIPLIPTGTFRVERKREWISRDIIVIERLPLDWEQILKVWIVAAGGVFALIVLSRLVLNLGLRF
jgi:hypothetical protein